ncbi:MAG: hypothetical protein QXI89_01705 [Candidatus Anstonellales archaeon]
MQEITYEDFLKMNLVVGKIIKAERLGNKIIKLEVDIGNEIRVIAAGIAHYYKADEIIGKNVIIVENMRPKTIMGIESKGMLLACIDGDNAALITTDKEVKAGTKVS